jgi:hypothetical protein
MKVYQTLRIASAMCFLGHGAFGIITKAIWLNYFAVFGIGHDTAYRLMPVLGSVDILLGLVLLVYPLRIVAAWLVIWGLFTASLRPLSGEPLAELFERAGNFGAPLALVLLTAGQGWFRRLTAPDYIDARVVWCLRIAACLLLAGHGWLNLIEKQTLLGQYAALGFSDTAAVARVVGAFELLGALTILVKPLRSFVLILLMWKMATELFYPHWEVFEWIERGGSYGVLLALWFSLRA